jgi:hypothetical protein
VNSLVGASARMAFLTAVQVVHDLLAKGRFVGYVV